MFSKQDQKDKISLKIKIALKCEDSWVECPKHLYLANDSTLFSITLNFDELSEGKFYYSEIKAYDVDNLSRSCLFKVPLTIIKPIW